ncbi:hypothetical protein CALCODRAFT_328582 [Calocera cornea HHB12733]|uniref:Uncharacterized protein n=1 Tax=Calocera cornea HHB12733 TaxID=1353952 RepID=A0A165JHZ2_9BASI|nr:hypothetical protein CALCODRAFT_328582 [Calocera cornea HHB12733]
MSKSRFTPRVRAGARVAQRSGALRRLVSISISICICSGGEQLLSGVRRPVSAHTVKHQAESPPTHAPRQAGVSCAGRLPHSPTLEERKAGRLLMTTLVCVNLGCAVHSSIPLYTMMEEHWPRLGIYLCRRITTTHGAVDVDADELQRAGPCGAGSASRSFVCLATSSAVLRHLPSSAFVSREACREPWRANGAECKLCG